MGRIILLSILKDVSMIDSVKLLCPNISRHFQNRVEDRFP